jgi:hypothetical protein
VVKNQNLPDKALKKRQQVWEIKPLNKKTQNQTF